MPKLCSAVFCNNTCSKGSMQTFHRFPHKHPDRLRRWVCNMRRDKWNPGLTSVLCSDHFEEACFDRTGQTTRLRDFAEPTIFSFPEKFKKVTVSRKPPTVRDQSIFKTRTTEPTPSASQPETSPVPPLAGSSDCRTTEPTPSASQPETSPVPPLAGSSDCRTKQPTPSSSPTESSPVTPLAGPSGSRIDSFSPASSQHKYSKDHYTPQCLKRRLSKVESLYFQSKKKLKLANQRVRRLKVKVSSLHQVIDKLKNNHMLSNNAADVLSSSFSDVPLHLMKRMVGNKKSGKLSREKYSPELRSFALTLQFYSSKAYNYVRKIFDLALPHVSVIRSWYGMVKGEPGFTEDAFAALALQVSEAKINNETIQCAFMLDEMSIRKHVEWDGRAFRGFVDVGTGMDTDDLPEATEALVFMVVALNGAWKIPVGYFLINGLSGEERANLVKECLIRLHDTGVSVPSITFDGPSVHFSMARELGAALDINNLKCWFSHPANPDLKVNIFLDPCHVLKLLRNSWAYMKIFKDKHGNEINWTYIEALHDLQEKEGLRAGNKLRKAHIQWEKQKMKVNLAAQTLSSSVADAIEFCDVTLHLPQFRGSEATVQFIRTCDRWFDVMNSRNPLGRGSKSPLKSSNTNFWLPFLNETLDYFKNLTDVQGQSMGMSRRKTAFVGVCVSILSTINLFTYLVEETGYLKYLLMYKCSQDHLELFFCAIRGRGGWNNNPSARQFVIAYTRLLVRHDIKCSGGNVSVQDATKILTVTKNQVRVGSNDIDAVDVSCAKKYGLEITAFEHNDHDYDDIPVFPVHLTEFVENVVGHIAGYVVRMVAKRIMCEVCIAALQKSKDSTLIPNNCLDLLMRKTRGGLIIPSKSVVDICFKTEFYIRRAVNMNGGRPPLDKSFVPSLSSTVLGEMSISCSPPFSELVEHMYDLPITDNHSFKLIKIVVSCYARIRLFHVGKTYSEKIQSNLIRKKMSRLIIFSHQ